MTWTSHADTRQAAPPELVERDREARAAVGVEVPMNSLGKQRSRAALAMRQGTGPPSHHSPTTVGLTQACM
jgi:hypothetical protein